MRKSFSRLLYLMGLLCVIIGGYLLSRAYTNARVLPNGALHPAQVAPAVSGLILCSLAILMLLAAWVGALFKTARLHRWGWFICLLLFSGLALLLYIFFGPKTPPYRYMPATTPPYGGFGD